MRRTAGAHQLPLGVYVHFPYCTTRCPYCDFAVHARRRIPHDAYAEAVVHELRERRTFFPEHRAVSAYFGGGTPGLWRPDALGAVLRAIQRTYLLADDAEVTVEVNPGETDEAHLAALAAIGVNRISLGAQSFDARSLAVLGRVHRATHTRAAVAAARRAGLANVSIDLIFGLPGARLEAVDADLDALLALEVEHVSAYGLTIEPRTAFYALERSGDLSLPPAERQAELYERIAGRLAAAGYRQHEISSWARPGREARHNSLYWRGVEYLGVGSSASSLRLISEGTRVAAERFVNHRSVDRYLAAHRAGAAADDPAADGRTAQLERLDPDALEREALWLGLRLVAGIERADHRRRYGRDPVEAGPRLTALAAAGLVDIDAQHVRLSARGRLLADEVGAQLI